MNEDAYDSLIVSIEASEGMMSLLIAVCDDMSFRDRIIARYESELASDFQSYQLRVPKNDPNLKRSLLTVVEQEEYLKGRGKAILSVVGLEEISPQTIIEQDGRTEQEVFFGYLQWTREGLRQIRHPIVIWVTTGLLTKISQKAPDFWSWRKGCFHFQP
jgi:hypothetical protein